MPLMIAGNVFGARVWLLTCSQIFAFCILLQLPLELAFHGPCVKNANTLGFFSGLWKVNRAVGTAFALRVQLQL